MSNKEKQTTAAHYIINFYNQILALNQEYSRYINLMTELNVGSNKDNPIINPTYSAAIKEIVNNLRHYSNIIYLQYISISSVTKTTTSIDLTDTYEKIKNNYVIKMIDLDIFIKEINKFLLENVIYDLLKTSNDIVTEIYANDTGN